MAPRMAHSPAVGNQDAERDNKIDAIAHSMDLQSSHLVNDHHLGHNFDELDSALDPGHDFDKVDSVFNLGHDFDEVDSAGTHFQPPVTSTPVVGRYVGKLLNSIVAFPRFEEDSGLGSTPSFTRSRTESCTSVSRSDVDDFSPIVKDSLFSHSKYMGKDADIISPSVVGKLSPNESSKVLPAALDASTPVTEVDSGVFTHTPSFNCASSSEQLAVKQAAIGYWSTPIGIPAFSTLTPHLVKYDQHTMQTRLPVCREAFNEFHSEASSSLSCSPVKHYYSDYGSVDSDDDSLPSRWAKTRVQFPNAHYGSNSDDEDEAFHSPRKMRQTRLYPVDEAIQGTELAERLDKIEVSPENKTTKIFDFSGLTRRHEAGTATVTENAVDKDCVAVNVVDKGESSTDRLTLTDNVEDQCNADSPVRPVTSAVRVLETLEEVIEESLPSVPSMLVGRFIGYGTMDIVGELHKRSVPAAGVFRWLHAYLDDNDFIRMAGVCRLWRTVLLSHAPVRKYLDLVRRMHTSPSQKENCPSWGLRGSKTEECRHMTRSSKCLGNIQLAELIATQPLAVTSTPFEKVRQRLAWEDFLRHCPMCSRVANILPCHLEARCSNPACQFHFCTRCLFPAHPPAEACPYVGRKPQLKGAPGSQKCKKMLKRLHTF